MLVPPPSIRLEPEEEMPTLALGVILERAAQDPCKLEVEDFLAHLLQGGGHGNPRLLRPLRMTQAVCPHQPAGGTASKASSFGGEARAWLPLLQPYLGLTGHSVAWAAPTDSLRYMPAPLALPFAGLVSWGRF